MLKELSVLREKYAIIENSYANNSYTLLYPWYATLEEALHAKNEMIIHGSVEQSFTVVDVHQSAIFKGRYGTMFVGNIERTLSDVYDKLSDELRTSVDMSEWVDTVILNSITQGYTVLGDFTRNYKQCDRCGKWHAVTAYTDDPSGSYCNECYGHYTKCPVCHRTIKKSNLMALDAVNIPLTASERMRFSKGVCSECISELTSKYTQALDYHEKPEESCLPLFYSYGNRKNKPLDAESDSGMRYFGIELECVIDYVTLCEEYEEGLDCAVEDVLYNVSNKYPRHIYANSDSSLEPYGYEFITHPMTSEFLTKSDVLDTLTNACEYAGFYTNRTCGLHIHVNRKSLSKYSVAKMNTMLYRLESEYSAITALAERENRLSEWSEVTDFWDVYQLDDTTDMYHRIYDIMSRKGRYVALNSQNSNTVEFRFFGGTLDAELIRQRVQFVNAMCSYANNHSLMDCMYITPDLLIEWDKRVKPLFTRCL